MSGWQCRYLVEGRCELRRKGCDPGDKGCILKGRFEFPLMRTSEPDTEARDRILGGRKDQ
jgi:hypothetical protein